MNRTPPGPVIVAVVLPFAAPRAMSADSAFYTHAAVTGQDLFHPHHLIYAAYLRGWFLIGSAAGLGEAPWISIRAGAIAAAATGIFGLYAMLRGLGVARPLAGWATLLGAASGLYWQFSTQAEAYVPASAALAWAVAALAAATTPHRRLALGWAGRWRFWLAASFLLALATMLHQAAVLAVPAFGALALVRSRRHGMPFQARTLLVAGFIAAAGAMSICSYAVGWRLAAPDVSFAAWLTKYARWEGMPWGLASNFSAEGLRLLLLSWGASWLNATPSAFYKPLPDRYALVAAAWLAALFGAFATLARPGRGNSGRLGHALWIVLWIVPFELFILWWTPFLRNFQALVLPPTVAVVALSAGSFRARTKRRVARLAVALAAVALTALNARWMVRPGLLDRSGPEGPIAAFRQHLRPGDVAIADIPDSLNLRALCGWPAVSTPVDSAAPGGPLIALTGAWRAASDSPIGRRKAGRIVIHPDALFPDQLALSRPGRGYAEVWNPIVDAIERGAGGRSRLRAALAVDGTGRLQALTLGVSPDLPKTAAGAYRRVATLAVDLPYLQIPAEQVARVFLGRMTEEERQSAAEAAGVVGHVASAAPAPWTVRFGPEPATAGPVPEYDAIAQAVVESTSTVTGRAAGADPRVRMAVDPPRDITGCRTMEVTATLRPPISGAKPGAGMATVQVFTMIEGGPDWYVENRSIGLVIPADGLPHVTSAPLSLYPWAATADRVTAIRVDPGAWPGSTFSVGPVVFR